MFEENEILHVRGNSFQILNLGRIEKFLKAAIDETQRQKEIDSKAKGFFIRLRAANGSHYQLG